MSVSSAQKAISKQHIQGAIVGNATVSHLRSTCPGRAPVTAVPVKIAE
jgi:hypothetical protein